jgi:hypothetical protein
LPQHPTAIIHEETKMANEHEIAQALSMTEDELLESLGIAAIGTEDIKDVVSSREFLQSVAAESNSESAARLLSSSLLGRGKTFFWKLWEKVKGIVCYIHNEGIKIEGDADLVKYLVGVIVAAGAIANGLAVLVVTIAVKMGLTNLCPTPKN